MMLPYTDAHRAFLQVLANRGTLSIPQAVDILDAITKKHGDKENVPAINLELIIDYMQQINHKLVITDQKLVFVQYELDVPNKEFIVFTNMSHNSALKHIGANTELESNYFKLVLESIAVSGCYYMPSIHILNLATNVVSTGHKKLTKQRAQELMDDWVSTGYFVEQFDMIHFGPRAIGEFQDYLRLRYKERICICALCVQPTFKGIPCANDNCSVVLHEHCLQKYFARNKKCPKCKQAWTYTGDDE